MNRRARPRGRVPACPSSSPGALAGAAVAVAAKHPAGPTVGPSGLRFYAPGKLPAGPHGTLIWERALHGSAALRRATNDTVLYTQVGVKGKLVPVSGIVSVPKGTPPKGGWPVVAYAHGTTGIASQCAPSRDTGAGSGAHGADIGVAPPGSTLDQGWLRRGPHRLRGIRRARSAPVSDRPLRGLWGPGHRACRPSARPHPEQPDHHLRPLTGRPRRAVAASLAPRYTPDLHLLGTVAFARRATPPRRLRRCAPSRPPRSRGSRR